MNKKEIIECGNCGRKLKVSRRKFKKWENGVCFFWCKECLKITYKEKK